MKTLTQPGTRTWALLWLLLSSCSSQDVDMTKGDVGMAGGPASAADGGTSCQPQPCPSGSPWNQERCACVAPFQPECESHDDCTLVGQGCCGSCVPPGWDDVRVVPKTREREARERACPTPSTCGACYETDPDPLAPLLVAACVAQRCEVVNLRSDRISYCTQDSDCETVERTTCPQKPGYPADYAALRTDADHALLSGVPSPACMPAPEEQRPIAYCARDNHCAVRRRETELGQPSSTCYSPTQHPERAQDTAANGCDCKPLSIPVCRNDGSGLRVNLECGAKWHILDDIKRCPR